MYYIYVYIYIYIYIFIYLLFFYIYIYLFGDNRRPRETTEASSRARILAR